MRPYCKSKDVDASVHQVYTDEEERASAINYLMNHSAAMEEPFNEVVSKKNKKQKGFPVHFTPLGANI